MTDLSTAHLAWDRHWREGGDERWSIPEPSFVGLAADLRRRGVRRALDLGCGVGRHALHLAAEGFDVTAVDAAGAGLDRLREDAERLGLDVDARQGPFHEVPAPDASFGYVLAWNVLYHGDGQRASEAMDEVRRILEGGGTFQFTMLSKRHHRFGAGTEVRPGTFVDADGPDDKAHPHYYCDRADVVSLLNGMRIVDLVEAEQGSPGSWHWHAVAVKP